MSKSIAYDLGVAVGAITLWLTPWDVTRAVGYATSIVFSGRGYYTGICLLSRERRNDEAEAMNYDASLDFHERLLESAMELKVQQLENRFTEYLIPLVQRSQQLQKQLASIQPTHPEIDPVQSAQRAIDEAFAESHNDCETVPDSPGLTQEDIRRKFPADLDQANWKAICKALASGNTRDEVIRDVLQCEIQLGIAYLDLLKQKFM